MGCSVAGVEDATCVEVCHEGEAAGASERGSGHAMFAAPVVDEPVHVCPPVTLEECTGLLLPGCGEGRQHLHGGVDRRPIEVEAQQQPTVVDTHTHRRQAPSVAVDLLVGAENLARRDVGEQLWFEQRLRAGLPGEKAFQMATTRSRATSCSTTSTCGWNSVVIACAVAATSARIGGSRSGRAAAMR